MPKLPPDILLYNDYRVYLRNFYEYKKSLRHGFSYRLFAKNVGLKSPNYLQLVIQGKRNMSHAVAERVAKVLKLSPAEKSFFLSLVMLENANDKESFDEAKKKNLEARSKLVMKQVPSVQKSILEKPHHLLVRELVTLSSFKNSPQWVSKKLRGILSEEEAAESLAMQISAGYLKIKDNKLIQSEPSITTGQAFDELGVLKYHIETLKIWTKILLNTDKDNRELGVLNIPIDSKKIPEFKKRIREFQSQIIGWLESESNADSIVQLGTYMIPLTDREV